MDFQKYKIFTVDLLPGASVRHRAKFHQNRPKVAEIGRFNVFFQNGRRPLSWICWVPIGTTGDGLYMVSIVLPNLVKIDAVVSITGNFQYFARLA